MVIGEGGSGGALALGVADRILMLEHSTYSVISPEGCAAILWNNGAKASEAAELLKITAQDLFQMKVVDEVVEEPIGGAHRDPRRAAELLKEAVVRNLAEIRNVPSMTCSNNGTKSFVESACSTRYNPSSTYPNTSEYSTIPDPTRADNSLRHRGHRGNLIHLLSGHFSVNSVLSAANDVIYNMLSFA